jgi:hypothetical protein
MTAPTLLQLQDEAIACWSRTAKQIEDGPARARTADQASRLREIVAQAYGVVPSTPLGLPDSAITQLMQHIEMSMLSEGVDPETTTRVINQLLFGHPDGLPPRQGPGAPAAAFEEETASARD